MNKIIKTLLVVMVLVLTLAALVACDQPVEQTTTTTPVDPNPEVCDHSCVQEFLPGYDATCTEEGLRPGFKCPDCGEYTKEQVVVPARGHKMADATCTAPMTCTECGLKEGEALGHDMQAVEAVDGCEYAPGYNAHMACTRCDYTEGKEVVVVDHDFVEEELFYYPSNPTCTEGAYIAGYCVYCEKGLILAEVPALGHTWVGGDCTTPETCSACGAEGELIHTELEDGTCACGYVLVETAEELIAALEAGKKVLLMNNIEMDAAIGHPYGGGFVGVVQRGGELNGNGYTLTVHGTYAILTYGGTIKNLTVDAGFRAIALYAPEEDVILDNVTVYGDDIVYGLNTQEYPKLEDNIDIVVKNSTICGWISFAGTYASVTFENCEFIQGVAYGDVIGRLVRPYISTTFTNCTFVQNAYLDLSALAAGETVTLVGCKVAGVDVTLDVFTTEEDHAEIPFTYEAPAGVELVLTAVEGGVSFHRHGHTLSETVASSCTVAGKEVYTCACGDSYENALELGEHDYDHVVTAPTCTAAGYTTHTCVFCDDSYTDTEVDALGHADANGDYKCDGCATAMLPADGTALTVEQAIAIAQLGGSSYTTQKYYITGIVSGLYNTTYGNFYIKNPETGKEICIYGLYSADGTTRYDAMSYKPVNGDEITVYTVLGTYNSTAQGKNAWLDEVVAHEHDYTSVVTDPGCLTEGYTTDTCSICGTSNVHSTVDALGHTTDAGECERCGAVLGGDAPVVGTLAEFTFGANGAASHADPSSKFSNGKSYTVNGYTLTFTSATNCYDGGRDAKGNSCMKMGTSSAVGSFTVTVPDNVTEVVIYVAQYKANTTKISVNGGTAQTITTASNNGAYTAIVIDTSVNKTFTFATVSGGVRCMIDTIVFNGTAQ